MQKPHFSNKELKISTVRHFVKLLNVIRNDGLNISGKFYGWKLSNITLENHRYKKIQIPKKSGGKRELHIPDKTLSFIQYCISILLSYYYKPNKNCFGYIQGKSIKDNASIHVGKDVIVNIDLKDFFGSIDAYKIQDRLTRYPFRFSKEVAELISQLVTTKTEDHCFNPIGEIVNHTFLPQGSPCSPIISNIVADSLDFRLSRLSQKYGFTYSRYVDDLTFSFNKNLIPEWFGYDYDYGFKLLIYDIIQEEGFDINRRKTRISYKNQKHEVTGLTVNKKVNIKRSYIKNLRTILHNWEKDGYGNANMEYFLKSKNCEKFFPNLENSVSGMLSFIKMVKGADDSTYLKLMDRFQNLCNRDREILKLSAEIDARVRENSKDKGIDTSKFKIGSLYHKEWRIKDCKPFSEDWINACEEAQIEDMGYGAIAVLFSMKRGDKIIYTELALGEECRLRDGDFIDIKKAVLLTLSHPKYRDVERVEII